MKEDLICIYDDTKEDFEQLLINIYSDFIENSLRNYE